MKAGLLDFVGQSTGCLLRCRTRSTSATATARTRLTERAVAEATRMVAGRGFSMPQGTLVRLIQQAIGEGMNKDAEDSRTVMIEQAPTSSRRTSASPSPRPSRWRAS
jgi:hypothetical protein